ncbi:MFS transporter [Neptunomonas phycophila]|uniref:MFS transporter n=2 Tax=Neptunomonas phycophila TaxID=1572645 RepID=A0AAW7XFZ0_9GAMM|nr:MFS transporter [Neptunomonas phycophila]MDO6451989.1 MFS transporter [Neptunomonas phycophila]
MDTSITHSTPPKAGLVWVVIALALGTFALGTTEFASMTMVPYIAENLGVGVEHVSYAISAYALGVVVGSPIIMVMTVRVRRRKLLLILTAAMAIANGLSALSPSLGWLVFFRFLSGLSHGAYFGTAMLLAASLVPSTMKARVMSQVFLGLTIATIAGVPLATWMGQNIGWRWSFVMVTLLFIMAAIMIYVFAPNPPAKEGASPLKELETLKSREVWYTLGIAAIGGGGLFCVYTYLSETLRQVTHAPAAWIPIMMVIFGLGSTIGNLVSGWAADKSTMKAALFILIFSAIVLAIYPSAAGSLLTLVPVVFLIGCSIGLAAIIQPRLMDIAPEGQAMAGALVQCAFNLANAIGPWAGSLVITAGFSIADTGYAASFLSVCGLVMWWLAMREGKKKALQPER